MPILTNFRILFTRSFHQIKFCYWNYWLRNNGIYPPYHYIKKKTWIPKHQYWWQMKMFGVQTSHRKNLLQLVKRRSKSSSKEYVTRTQCRFRPEKNKIQKLRSTNSLVMACLLKLNTHLFLRSSRKVKTFN